MKDLALLSQSTQTIKALAEVNHICPVSDEQLEIWTGVIHRVYPDLLEYEINEAVDRLLTGKVEWNSFIGIQNITKIIASIRTTRINTKDFY